MRNKLVSVFSSPSSMRLRISLSEVWTHLSQVLAVIGPDAFNSGGTEFGRAFKNGLRRREGDELGSLRHGLAERKRAEEEQGESLTKFAGHRGQYRMCSGEKSAAFSWPQGHNTMRASRDFLLVILSDERSEESKEPFGRLRCSICSCRKRWQFDVLRE